ncbi:TPA_asm: P6 [Picris trirhavirus 1]|nr:TPA_asm: P6 [Picris trirhavirus 1]
MRRAITRQPLTRFTRKIKTTITIYKIIQLHSSLRAIAFCVARPIFETLFQTDVDRRILFDVWKMENVTKLPDIPEASVVFVPPKDATQNDIFSALRSPMIADKVAEEYEESPAEAPKMNIEDIMLPDPTLHNSIHSRAKTSFSSAAKALKDGLTSFGIMPDDSLVDSIVRHSKHAILTSTEMEAISITIRACQEEYALNLLKASIDELTTKIRSMTSELDDASKRVKGVNHSLTQNIELVNAQIQSLKANEPMPPPVTPIPQVPDHQTKAHSMLSLFMDTKQPATAVVIRRFAEHLKVEKPHLSIESFKAMSRPQMIEYISTITKRYNHIS